MSRYSKAIVLLCCLFLLKPVRADYSSLEASTSGVTGPTVTVAVHNPTGGSVTARIRVWVQTDPETFYLLTSSNFTVTGSGTIFVKMTAPAPVLEIVDSPEPINPQG